MLNMRGIHPTCMKNIYIMQKELCKQVCIQSGYIASAKGIPGNRDTIPSLELTLPRQHASQIHVKLKADARKFHYSVNLLMNG